MPQTIKRLDNASRTVLSVSDGLDEVSDHVLTYSREALGDLLVYGEAENKNRHIDEAYWKDAAGKSASLLSGQEQSNRKFGGQVISVEEVMSCSKKQDDTDFVNMNISEHHEPGSQNITAQNSDTVNQNKLKTCTHTCTFHPPCLPPVTSNPQKLSSQTFSECGPRKSSVFVKAFHRSSSAANLIHFYNLEPVSIKELYSESGSDNITAFGETKSFQDFADNVSFRQHKISSLSIETSQRFGQYKSHSCPLSPVRTRHSSGGSNDDLETSSVHTDSSSDTIGCNLARNESFSSDGNETFYDDIYPLNSGDDGLSDSNNEVPISEASEAELSSRQRSASACFATLFNRCRIERDADTAPGTPLEDDNHASVDEIFDACKFLCAERVSQMTKTYNDIEAVTRLLEEKERDLELAARIGQTLLSKNKELATRSETLEEQLNHATDKVHQLRHEISMKDELLRIYNEDLDHEGSGGSTPNDKSGSSLVNVDFLEKKVQTLEDENVHLRLESSQLRTATDNYEEKEKRLVEDCIQQLAEVNHQVESLAEELHHKAEENIHQKEEITGFLSQIADLQTKIRKLTLENMDLHERLTESTESQRKLTRELGSMQDKYDELFEMLEEAQDELRLVRSKHKIRSSGHHHHSSLSIPADSLASELETSLQRELSESNRRSYSWKVFETAKAAKRAAAKASGREPAVNAKMSTGVPACLESDSQAPSACPSDVESFNSDGYSADMDSLYGSNPELGQPGIPGSNDLESALKRLAMRRANELNERDYQEQEEERRKMKVNGAMSSTFSPYTKSPDSHGFVSPAGSASSAWGNSGGLSASGPSYKLSEKLQIVKPLEGSMTLRHWQHLATPHLGGIFEERDGVQIKGEKKLDLVEEVYSLSDFEEDEAPDVHTRREQDLSLIYTYTNSTVRNPGPYRGQGDMFGSSTISGATASQGIPFTSDDMPMQSSTPKMNPQTYSQAQSYKQSADSTQSTYSSSLGLASLLQGRENTGVGRALLRASSASQKTNNSKEMQNVSTAVTSTSDLNQRVLSSRSFGNSPLVISAPKNLPGSRSFDQAVKEYEEKAQLNRADPLKKAEHFAPGMTGQGFLQQLKDKGFSLYGLWGGGKKKESSTDGREGEADDSTKTTADSVFSGGAGGGVLGALTDFRRNGML